MIRPALAAALALLPATALAQSAEEVAMAKRVLAAHQPPSFANDLEYCGYLGWDAAGTFTTTETITGDAEGCTPEAPDGFDWILSWHTHAAFNDEYDSEVPSVIDVEADEAEGIDGFVATPGGRLWYVDTTDMEVRQLCGLGCLPQDPAFVPGIQGVIEESYTYEELLALEAG
ncbi:MAG: DUF4329 domain-containing protein [Shimia sp.]